MLTRFKEGDRLVWSRCDGPVIARIKEVHPTGHDTQRALITVDGWVGSFWETLGHDFQLDPGHGVLNCPACGGFHVMRGKADYAPSRYCGSKICPPCGTREALSGDFWSHKRGKRGKAVRS